MEAVATALVKVRPVLRVCRRYAVTVLFPTITGWLIYADYSRTQRWKKSKAISEMTLAATLWRRSKYFVAFPMITVAYIVGHYIEREDNLSLTRYRGKSKLYGREYAPGEKPPWP